MAFVASKSQIFRSSGEKGDFDLDWVVYSQGEKIGQHHLPLKLVVPMTSSERGQKWVNSQAAYAQPPSETADVSIYVDW